MAALCTAADFRTFAIEPAIEIVLTRRTDIVPIKTTPGAGAGTAPSAAIHVALAVESIGGRHFLHPAGMLI
jgi:hypothetical protein